MDPVLIAGLIGLIILAGTRRHRPRPVPVRVRVQQRPVRRR